MMKKTIYTIILSALFFGCEEYMDFKVDSDSSKKLVVEGMISTDTTAHKVILSRSDDFFIKKPQQMETGAIVSISEGLNNYLLHEISPGVYVTDSTVYGEIGKTYTLNIKLTDTTEYSATETIVALPEIDSITVHDTMNVYIDGFILFYYGYEKPGIGDYYMWSLGLNNELYTDSIIENVFTDDQMADGQYIKDFPLFYIPSSDITRDTIDFELTMYSISGVYYDYLTGLLLETVWKGSPWDGPPANAIGNISNEAFGYFKACDVKRKTERVIR